MIKAELGKGARNWLAVSDMAEETNVIILKGFILVHGYVRCDPPLWKHGVETYQVVSMGWIKLHDKLINCAYKISNRDTQIYFYYMSKISQDLWDKIW